MSRLTRIAGLGVLLLCTACSHNKTFGGSASAPPPPPEQKFLVFFPGDSTDITAEGKDTVTQIVKTAAETHPKRITVTGEDDGGTAHDAEVASTRGKNVAAALITGGLPGAAVVQVPGAPPATASGIAAHNVVVKFES